MRLKRRTAMTLVEVLMVVAIVGILAALTLPDFGTFGRSRHMDQSVERLRAVIAMCRAEAMNQSRVMRLEFRRDGKMRVRQQADPIEAPHLFVAVDSDWAETEIVLEDVWVEAILELPDGPPPILIDDDNIDFEESEEDVEPLPIGDFEEDVWVDFEPDGSSGSLRWVLRDAYGRGVQMTLDGRLGRVEAFDIEAIPADEAIPPEPLDEDDEEDVTWEGSE
ncbi:MAG: prepilin-type N-terminal cleavage/methylation domain-containing protein [Phycisphaerae bacterium]|nr:prepilin-type N-terminal cleavage/methylation domain-containing protein [Phycisphaerae bacterium]